MARYQVTDTGRIRDTERNVFVSPNDVPDAVRRKAEAVKRSKAPTRTNPPPPKPQTDKQRAANYQNQRARSGQEPAQPGVNERRRKTGEGRAEHYATSNASQARERSKRNESAAPARRGMTAEQLHNLILGGL